MHMEGHMKLRSTSVEKQGVQLVAACSKHNMQKKKVNYSGVADIYVSKTKQPKQCFFETTLLHLYNLCRWVLPSFLQWTTI
jgi:hypothetical protein